MKDFQKGDILQGSKRCGQEAFHRVVYLDGPGDAPLSAMLTTSNKYPCNKLLQPEHVESGAMTAGQHFVSHRLQKLREWGPYNKIGRLTAEGVEFIENELPAGCMEWDDYQKQRRRLSRTQGLAIRYYRMFAQSHRKGRQFL